MMRSLYAGVSGLKTHQTKMDVIGNNIANVNTVAFKSSSTTFSEIMYQTISGASGPTANKGGINAKQIGLGVTMGSTSVNVTAPGATQTTGDPFDLKITGDSFFVVNNGSENLFTKAGAFCVDSAGNLVTKANGFQVMGWQVDPTTGQIRQDTVSALRIMQEKNMTAPPEATTKATCGGILDANNTQINSANGFTMNLAFYDSMGYSYNAKFAVRLDSAADKTYTVELTDILDSKNQSILTPFLNTQGNNLGMIFGNQTTIPHTYALTSDFTYTGGQFSHATTGPLTPGTNTAGQQVYTAQDGTEYNLQTMFGLSADEADDFIPANITASGTNSATYSYTTSTYAHKLDFDNGNGTFNYVGAPGQKEVRMDLSVLGPMFENIDIDFSSVKNSDNSGKCTMDIEKGQVVNEAVTGDGKKLGAMTGLAIAEDGKIFGSYDNGNTVLLGQVAVAIFSNPAGLEKIGENCYKKTLNSGDFDGVGKDISADGGKMSSGVLEMSNVDLSSEFTEMITTQRGFQANSRIITTSDTLLEELINLKR